MSVNILHCSRAKGASKQSKSRMRFYLAKEERKEKQNEHGKGKETGRRKVEWERKRE